MPWLTRVKVSGHPTAKSFEAHLDPQDGASFQHLVLTGPNGSGKTTLLEHLVRRVAKSMKATAPAARLACNMEIAWSVDDAGAAWRENRFVCISLSMQRTLVMAPVDGPSKMDLVNAGPSEQLANKFLAYLVNQQVQARLARDDDPVASNAIFSWFADLEQALADLFDRPGFRIQFVRETYDIRFVEPSGLSYGFAELPSGFAAVLRILAEIVLRVDALGLRHAPNLSGVVLIDEIDAFLHPALQERVLPFLVRAYPQLQFVVATHSPEVVSSVENATVVALGTGDVRPARDFVGLPYDQLLTSLFGLDAPLDTATTDRLHRLDELWQLDRRSPDQEAELRELANDLQRTNNPRAIEIWLQLQLESTA